MTSPLRAYAALQYRYLRPHAARLGALALLLLTGIGASLTAPQFVRHFIDTAQGQGDFSTLYAAAALFLGASVLSEALAAASAYVGDDVAWRATNRMRADLLLHALRLDLSFHNAHTPGELIQRINEDAARLSNFLSQFVIRLLGGVLLAIGALAILGIEDWRIGLAMAGFAVVFLVVHTLLERIQLRYLRIAYRAKDDLDGWLGERFAAVRDIRTSGAQAHEMSRFLDVQRRDVIATIKGIVAWRGGGAAAASLFHLGTAFAMGLGLYLFMSENITVGTVYLIIHYLALLQAPLLMMSREVEDLQRARVSLERVTEIFDTRSKIVDNGSAPLPPGAPSIEFKRVSFSYAPPAQALDDVSFRIEPGRVLGLLGRTGSGKTTLGRLIFRLYEPQQGSVEFGGVDIRAAPVRALRRRIGMVTQDVRLFHASVRENLTLFDPTIPDARIMEAIDLLGLREWLDTLGGGLDGEIDPTAAPLSDGEAQLLAFARVFLRDPDVVIMDEASSRLDNATEARIGRAVERLLADRTGIVIAHKLATIERVDDILIIENGRVLEFGRRAALAADSASRFSALLRTGREEVLR